MRTAGWTSAAARVAAAAVTICCALVPATAQAVVSPPVVSAFFAQGVAVTGADVGLGFTVSNTDAVQTLTGVGFAVALPAGLVVSTPSQLFTTCDGSASATDGGSTITLSGASLQAAGDEGGSCLVVLDIVAPAGPGVVMVASGAATSNESGPGSPSNTASLQVLAAPTIAESFAAPSIRVGQATTLTYMLNNPNATAPLYELAFADALPAGLTVASPANVGATCVTGTLTADPGATTIALAGLTVDGATQCSVSVDVTATAATISSNPTGPLSYSFDTGAGELFAATAPGTSATLVAIGPPLLTVAFGAPSIAPGATTKLTFSLANPNLALALTGVGFGDALPSGLVVATPAGVAGSCGGATITAAAGSGSIALSGATLPAGAGCTFSVDVTGVSVGEKANTTSAVSSAEGGSGPAATATLLVAAPPVAKPPIGVVAPPGPPSNVFKAFNVRAAGGGIIRFDVTVPGAGDVNVLETLGAASERIRKPGSHRFTMARKVVHASKRGTLHITVRPNARAKRAIRRAHGSLRVNVWISFRPTGGRAGDVVRKTVVLRLRR